MTARVSAFQVTDEDTGHFELVLVGNCPEPDCGLPCEIEPLATMRDDLGTAVAVVRAYCISLARHVYVGDYGRLLRGEVAA